MKNRFQPRTEKHGEIERRKSALADDHGMNEFDGDMLRIGGVGAASEGEQTASVEKALGHGVAGFRQTGCFAGKEFFDDLVAREQALFDLRCKCAAYRRRRPYTSNQYFLTNARQGIADQHIHDPAAAVTRGDQNRARRLFAHFADHLRFLAAGREA